MSLVEWKNIKNPELTKDMLSNELKEFIESSSSTTDRPIEQVIQQEYISCPINYETPIIHHLSTKSGKLDIKFITGIVAPVSTNTNSNEVFASCVIIIKINTETKFESISQIPRCGTSTDGLSSIRAEVVLDIDKDDIISVFIKSNDDGIHIPQNSNTRLIII